MSKLSRPIAGLAAAAIGMTGAIVTGGVQQVASATPAECTPANTVHLLSFNDFHGRIEGAAQLFTPVEQLRASAGEGKVLLVSNGDSIGGSTFVSAVSNDQPTLDVLNAAGLEASATGNHEFDKGFDDLAGRVASASQFPYLGANVVKKGTNEVAAPVKAYEVFEKGGAKIAVVGAVTGDLPSLVSPSGISQVDVKDPVESVNAIAKQLKDGDESNGEADIVIANIHEGSPDTKADADTAKSSPNFSKMYNGLDASVDAVINGHTHTPYLSTTAKGQPIVQADAYAKNLVQLDLNVDASGTLCSLESKKVEPAKEADASLPRIQEINTIVEAAKETAKEKGSEVVGKATEAISTPGAGGSGTRDQESPMTNMVAQMFYDQMSNGNDEFIGIQNPGGTRDSFDKGDITYEEAALVLPFANSLNTTEITGAQFIQVLNQQWQRDDKGEVPSRPYLALGLSKNVTYTYDESLPEGQRITGVWINGKPIDEDKMYTVGSGSFLISGGDNFRAFQGGQNTRDAGLVDLTTWVDWLKEKREVSPDYTKRGVSVTDVPESFTPGKAGTVKLGAAGEVYKGNLDMLLDADNPKVSPQLANKTVKAFLGETQIGEGTVADGVAEVSLTFPEGTKAGKQTVRFVVDPSGTEVRYDVNVAKADTKPDYKATSAKVATRTPVGREANMWGTVDGKATVSTQVKLPNGKWSTSQTRDAKGFYAVPLTYGRNTAGTYQWRLRVVRPDGTMEFTKPVTQVRVALPTAATAGTKALDATTYAWGKVSLAKGPQKVFTQVKLPNGKWSTSQVRTTKADGGYTIELTYGRNTRGTYTFRVGTYDPQFGYSFSKPVTLTRR
ncbi:bifunctional UDP-sugar hydrolase/5'-nucleotidase [uncultured Tessaracoccus sp.]|uniref:bifunctional metallophosphatase/5'-nucleotidase n=1 Tax=uncultured Tessaracoccus sp. TaxID=905023 RepID=UPI002603C26F|nr:bifunctional UDP-sugar hydrolase/5'-nucleotidase [uncultured Tessaracoccus sp.]